MSPFATASVNTEIIIVTASGNTEIIIVTAPGNTELMSLLQAKANFPLCHCFK